MITSNIDEIILKSKLDNQTKEDLKTNDAFLNSLIEEKNKDIKTRDNSLTYENIKGISLEEIDEVFTNDEDKQKAKNLRLSTLFSEDEYLSKSLFNTVLGQPFIPSYNLLFDMYEDKHNYFKSFNDEFSLGDLLHESMSNRINRDENSIDVIPQEYLDEVLLKVNSFNFLSALSSSNKDAYGRYKDEEDDYSFLYNDYYLKYQELIQKIEDQKTIEDSIIKQF